MISDTDLIGPVGDGARLVADKPVVSQLSGRTYPAEKPSPRNIGPLALAPEVFRDEKLVDTFHKFP